MRDDLFGFQQIIVNRSMPVTDQRHIETECGRVAAGRVNAVFGHAPGYDQTRNSGFVQHLLQRSFVKRTARLLPDNWLAVEFAETHYQARACAECGNVQIVLTTRYAGAAAV